ncbi:C39 family peptidase [Brevibacillus sp. H7]|uniref:C39 family peptidase n=1 Tax=Brevibacillus sp. H7 TaxID=3349138 RepID=UPI0038204CBB
MTPEWPIAIATAAALLAGCAAPQAQEPPPQMNIQNETKSPEMKRPPIEPAVKPRPAKAMLNVPIISQKPELKNGCEVTSLAMLLRYVGHEVDKMALARQVKKDPEPLVQKSGDIKEWGDPNKGFVGDMTGKRKGFAVYNKPLEELLRRYVGERAVNLTGKPYEAMLDSIAKGRPVVVWATGDFALPTEWESWRKDGQKIVAPFDEHVVLLVGYDESHAYVNNPLTGAKQQRVKHTALRKSWEALGRQAITYR